MCTLDFHQESVKHNKRAENEVKIPVEGLGYLSATAQKPDEISYQISVGLELNSGEFIDLSTVEIKRTDDYIRKDRMKFADIQKALELD